MTERKWTGLVQVYTGNGKGKTTAALGLALRATGNELRVCFLQFMKGNTKCGEHRFVEKVGTELRPFDIICPNDRSCFGQSSQKLHERAADALDIAREVISKEDYDIVVLDEILTAIAKELLTSEQVLDLIKGKPAALELVLTGRNAPPSIIDAADLVTEMVMVKHPYKNGVKARKGIEF